MDATVTRNFFGRQDMSRYRKMHVTEAGSGLGDASYFIRSPALTGVGPRLTVLATTLEGVAVAGRQGNLMATCFHPEISNDDSYLKYFLTEVPPQPMPCGALTHGQHEPTPSKKDTP